MVFKKAKSKTKKKKVQIDPGIRSDIWKLDLSGEQKDLARLTVAQYRHFLKPVVLITYWGWNELSVLTSKERVNTVEKMFNKTAANPSPKYAWFFEKAIQNHPSFRKFPSYLRRAAIQDAIGIVSSFVTRWNMWKRGERKHRHDRAPKLTSACDTYPARIRSIIRGRREKSKQSKKSVIK